MAFTSMFDRARGRTALLLAGAAAATLCACAPDLGPAPQLKPAAGFTTAKSFTAPAAGWPTDAWWTAYDDPALNALEDHALAGAPDLVIAAARERQAQAQAEQSRAVDRPQLSVAASSQTTKQSLNEGFPDFVKSVLPRGYHTQSRATLDLDWDLDLFGADRARLAAATSAAFASQADLATARLQLSTDVAGAWAELARLYEDRDAAVDALRVRTNSFNLVRDRLLNGLETRGEYAQAEGGIPAARADLESIERAIVVQRHAIAALAGDGPDAGLALPMPKPLAPRQFGLPADASVDLVGRRPDLVAARVRAEGAASRMKGAKADFYPNITLSGDYGLASLGVNSFFQTPDSIVGALGPALRLPIFSLGRLEGAYRQSRGEYDEAVASYDKTLAIALRDVADAVTGVQSLETQLVESRRALADDQEAYKVATLRYQGGLAPYLNVLTTESALIVQRRAVADLEGLAAGEDVQLVRALGGGYRDPKLAASSGAAPLKTASR